MVFDLVFGQILMTKYYLNVQMIGSKLWIIHIIRMIGYELFGR